MARHPLHLQVDRLGRIVIPQKLRKMFGLSPGTRLQLRVVGSTLALEPIRSTPSMVETGGFLVHQGDADGSLVDAVQDLRQERIDDLVSAVSADDPEE